MWRYKTLSERPISDLRKLVKDGKIIATKSGVSKQSNLYTGNVLQSKKVLLRLMAHVRNYEEFEAIQYAWENLNKLAYKRRSYLGEGKDLNDPKDVNNIKKKEERGVVCYHIYTFKFRGNEWIIKFEEHKKGFEQAYAIQKKS